MGKKLHNIVFFSYKMKFVWLFLSFGLICATDGRGLISPAKDRRDENKLNISRKFPHGVQDKYQSKAAKTPRRVGLLETMRIQMEASCYSFVSPTYFHVPLAWIVKFCYVQKKILRKRYDLLMAHKEDLGKLMTLENDKPIK